MIPFTQIAFGSINWSAVLVATLAAYVFGALWYSPLLFGKLWMKQSAVTKANAEKAKAKGMTVSYVLQFVATLVTTFVFAMILEMNIVEGVKTGLIIGFYIWLGFSATSSVGAVLWDKKSWSWFSLCASNSLLTLWIIGAILALWQ
ncbi:MAG: DUF1761 domain-containing protein [Candidatus Gracilibacteria bacterium]